MKILYLVTGLALGGAEKVVVDLADQMSLRGHQVKIAYLTGDILVKPKNKDIEIIGLELTSLLSLYSASLRYRTLISKYKPDVIHAHMIHANIFARLNRINCKVPRLLCSAHSSNEGGKIRMLAYYLTNFLSDFNSNVSQEATQALINKGAFNKENLKTVYNGIDLAKFNKSNIVKKESNNIVEFLAVGRFSPPKDYPNLLRAIALLKQKAEKPFHLYIAGDGELRPLIESLITSLGLIDTVTLLGKRSDIPDLLNQAHIFILASEHEGLPTVVLEAMACHCYVVATDCGGTAEIMENTGLLVPKQNSIALAEALYKSLQLDQKERDHNNLRARKRIEEIFSLERSVNTWLEYYAKS